MRKSVALVEKTAIDLCVVDTGNLRGSLRRETKRSPGVITGAVKTNVQYAPYVEFGTGRVGKQSPSPPKAPGITRYRMTPWVYSYEGKIEGEGGEVEDGTLFCTTNGQPARPFLYPALTGNKENIQNIFRLAYEKAIRAKGGGDDA